MSQFPVHDCSRVAHGAQANAIKYKATYCVITSWGTTTTASNVMCNL
jgi:hypothetical protein